MQKLQIVAFDTISPGPSFLASQAVQTKIPYPDKIYGVGIGVFIVYQLLLCKFHFVAHADWKKLRRSSNGLLSRVLLVVTQRLHIRTHNFDGIVMTQQVH